MDWIAWLGTAVLAVSLFGLGGRHRAAFLGTAFGEALWGVRGLVTRDPELVAVCGMFAVVALVNWWRWAPRRRLDLATFPESACSAPAGAAGPPAVVFARLPKGFVALFKAWAGGEDSSHVPFTAVPDHEAAQLCRFLRAHLPVGAINPWPWALRPAEGKEGFWELRDAEDRPVLHRQQWAFTPEQVEKIMAEVDGLTGEREPIFTVAAPGVPDTPPPVLPPPETAYCWMEYSRVEGYEAEGPRLLVPHADPERFESPYDRLFDTPEQAGDALAADVNDEQVTLEEAAAWVLCKRRLTPVGRLAPKQAPCGGKG